MASTTEVAPPPTPPTGTTNPAARVLLDVVHHFVDELGIVQPAKDLVDHGLLIGREELLDLERRDHPVVVHLRAQRIIERKGDFLFLFRGQAAVKRGNKRLRRACKSAGCAKRAPGHKARASQCRRF